ncbi:hypothetical protein FE257_008797 [Aspergillus nanangensis]|uniref:alpha-1,2-Mannosidase n=1 Tax=Aspergillus nanangensis TaxID=2582783 RepID=A0AAD4CKU3_ASPNN|nr:hypothetical protein FE257_008797 [Aspergillus nanangensis]
MFRARRYRVLLVFAAVFLLALVHFARSRDGSTLGLGLPADSPNSQPQNPPPPPPPPSAEEDNQPAPASPHGFSPESPESPESKDSESLKSDSDSDSKTSTTEIASGESESSNDASDEHSNSLPNPSQSKEEDGVAGFGSAHGQGKQSEDDDSESNGPDRHWKKPVTHFPIAPEELIKLPTGQSQDLPKLQADFKDESSADKMRRLDRLSKIKKEFEHAWSGYKASAFGHDEVKPLRGGYRDPFMGWGATLVDTLDTLWIMGLKEEFSIAVDQVKMIDFTTSRRKDIPLFETTIRYLGGLLGAYDVSGHKYDVLLEKAIQLADILIGAFDTPNHMPTLFYRWAPTYTSKPQKGDVDAVLAEIGSLSVEFTRLAQLTKEDKYYDAIARVTTELEKLQGQTILPGLWPTKLDASGCREFKSERVDDYTKEYANEIERAIPSDLPTPVEKAAKAMPTDMESYKKLLDRREADGLHDDAEPANYDGLTSDSSTPPQYDASGSSANECKGGLNNPQPQIQKFGMGALADSTYEYLPKEYMLLGGLNEQYQSMYKRAMDTAREHLVFRPMIKGDRDVRFLSTAKVSNRKSGSDRIAMAYEGTHLSCFAGGMFAMGAKIFGIEKDMDLAAKLTDGCVWAYESTKTGIMPEHFLLLPCQNSEKCEWNESEYWLALDPYAEERNARTNELKTQKKEQKGGNSIHGKRSWHVITSSTEKTDEESEAQKHETDSVTRSVSDTSHQEYVMNRIQTEHLPPGMVSIPFRKYILRPEAIESVFIMYRLTGENYWREKGWKMFEAISKYTRTEFANSGINDVTVDNPNMLDEMESFWLAETLKYFYLLFSDPSIVSLDEYVLNTEAHPLKRPEY